MSTDLPCPGLSELMEVRYALTPFTDFGTLPIGRRLHAATTGGTFSGERLSGEVLPGGTDWILVGADGTLRLNIDLALRTTDGALIHAHWTGYLIADPRTRAAFASGAARAALDPAGYSFRVSANFETGDASLAWLNSMIAVGAARFTEEGLHYRFMAIS